MHTYRHEKDHIQTALYSAISSIHFTLDLWLSPNHLSLLDIVAHYTNDNGLLWQSTLAMKEVEGQHMGENLAAVLLDVIRDYRIQNRLGYFMGDNTSNNDTMLQMVAE